MVASLTLTQQVISTYTGTCNIYLGGLFHAGGFSLFCFPFNSTHLPMSFMMTLLNNYFSHLLLEEAFLMMTGQGTDL